ncbi:MAG TPA: hypothetical protein VNX70_19930 [Bryobacteraceae bacterium]|nr:hypothetical protein [Bryobacteraceae bacterium]
MFVRKLILFCLSIALLAPLAAAKPPKPPKRHGAKKPKLNKSKAKFGTYKVKKPKSKG